MEQWVIAAKRADFNKIAEKYKISPVLARLIRNRDVVTEAEFDQYLNGTVADLPSPYLLKDAEKAAEITLEKISQEKKIRIISDYDVDGVSSNYILWKGLTRCGADVDYRIPHRVEDGYGINEHLIRQAKEDGIDTIITCDNGISAMEQVRYARNLGLTVIITDHHDIPFEEVEGEKVFHIPDAEAVVNPKQLDCPYPEKMICGAVVAFKFLQIIYDKTGRKPGEIHEFLEMAAIATVCDVMPLKGENRILVTEGLKRMQKTEITGLRALIRANNLEEKEIKSYHLGFVLGPCINASGRLQTAQLAMKLLQCEEDKEAYEQALEIKSLNDERKKMTEDGVEMAMEYLKNSGHENDKVLLVYLEDCHESIAGIIAGRIKEIYHRPVFVLTRSKEGLKGSARSIEAYNMYEEMTRVKECFLKYGGHPMAAGLSIEEDRLEELREKLNQNTTLTENDFIHKIKIDVALPFHYISEAFIESLSVLEPFGTDNCKPNFAQKDLKIKRVSTPGNSGRVVKFVLEDTTGYSVNAVYFGDSRTFMSEMTEHYGENTVDRLRRGLPVSDSVKMHVIYYPSVNEFRGNRSIEIYVNHYKFA